ncbi:protein PTST homolog 3, chloroplastic isoform X2 [Mercurialis annua]|uniref:protein PTST homolog 3, chloroplastic isoform X2 n=1 Tax=Mercurialis annua TaxID=3986 RepID=UPI0021608F52|nr:protein PTST homolog 3, chloroplastic isoform X2 [Mercurialis annua]
MATLYQFPHFLYLSSRKLFLNYEECKIFSNTHHYPTRKDFNFCICSANKSRAGRKVKSNTELCNDIKEFVAAVGLPEGHVPSMKEFSDNGRIDLAHIVRRRGYKFIRELLSDFMEAEIDGSSVGRKLDEKVEGATDESSLATEVSIQDDSGNDVITPECSSMPLESLVNVLPNEIKSMDGDITSSSPTYNIENLDDEDKHGDEDISLPLFSDNVGQFEFSSMSEDKSFSAEVLAMNNSYRSLNGGYGSNPNSESCVPVESLVDHSLEEKAVNLLKDQDKKVTDMVQDISIRNEVLNMENSTNDGSGVLAFKANGNNCLPIEPVANSSLEEKVAKFIKSGDLDAVEDESAEESMGSNEQGNEIEIQSKILSEENNKHAVNRSDAPFPWPGIISISKNDDLPSESLVSSDLDKNLDVETSKRENGAEISRLKFMLHQKELELSLLKEQIEKEKLALSDLQNKAEMEIRKAQKLVSEKGAELLAAEESLYGLVEVEIQYNGDAEIVEVAGSFNGWHHNIKLDPKTSSSIIDHSRSRKSKLWSTMLWLYPGVYEIKFIVDGHWTIDPQGEVVTRGGFSNNILRVVG